MEKKNFKTRKILVAVMFVGILFMQGNWVFAQFNPQGGPASRFGQTDANGPIQNHWIRSIGIGNFTNNGDMTHAFLHVNSNYLLLPQNGSIASLGEVFRTDCPANQSTYWRMWRDFKTVGDIFSQYSLDNIENDNFSMQATVRDITFHTQPFDENIIGEERMRIVGEEHSFEGIDILPGNVGIGTKHPTQKIDVVGNARLQDLPNATWQNEELTKCVVVDETGVLYWRNFNDNLNTTLGNECDGSITNPLDVNWDIPLDEYNFIFSGQFPNKSRVGIGIDGCQPSAKLDVLMNTDENISAAIRGSSYGALSGAYSCGIYGESYNAHISVGVEGHAESSTAFKNNGGHFTAGDAINNYGGYFETFSSNPNTINNYGVYAVCPHEVTGAPGNWAGYFEGNVNVEGSITATDYLSDQQFKQDIVDYNGALVKIRELRPVNFYFNTVNYNLNFPTVMQYGLIAQEVETVFPELVSDEIIPAKFDSDGNIVSESIPYKGLNYQQLTPIILQAVKELDETITVFMQTTETPQLKGSIEDLQYINDSLTQRLNSLEARLENIEQMLFYNSDIQMNNTKETSFQQEVKLENTKSIVLNQNVPNPFKENTTISFQIPEIVKEAKIVFIDNLGNILKQVEIQERGHGELIVYAHDLSAGHYTYYLVADGNTIESKKMVLTK